MSEPLYLHYETLARGELDMGGSAQAAIIPFRNTRVALVFRSKTKPSNAIIVVVNRDATLKKSPIFTPLEHPESSDDKADSEPNAWGGTWSPDGRVLVVYGLSPGRSDGKADAAVWILTQNDWIDDEPQASQRQMAPFVMRIRPRDLLAKDAPWRAAKTPPRLAMCSAFFPAKATRQCFLVTQDGWILTMEMQVASLLMMARSATANRASDDVTTNIKMSTVARVTNWHAGVTAVAYEPTTSTLVISGGLKNPSTELRAQGASSLSVWSVTSDDPVVELLDYTMVIGSSVPSNDDNETVDDDQEHTRLQSNGLMTKMRHSFLNPLKMLHGEDEDEASPTLPGTIRQLAISPDGVFLSIVHQDGHFRIRQIDTCADVLGWQFIMGDPSGSHVSAVSTTMWLSSSTLGFLTPEHKMVCGVLASAEADIESIEDSEFDDQDPSGTALQVVMQTIVMDDAVMPDEQRSMRWLASWTEIGNEDAMPATRVVLHDLSIVESAMTNTWQLSIAESMPKSQLMQSLIDARDFDRALALLDANDSHDLSEDLDFVYQQLWTEYRRLTTLETVAPGVAVLDTSVAFHGLNFEKALSCLNAIQHDHQWTVHECLHVVASDSLLEMKELLATGLRALMGRHSVGQHGHDQEAQTQVRATLLRYLYRLDTLNALIIAELDDDERRILADEQCFDGAVFTTFRDAPIVEVASGLAKEGRLEALAVLFRRNGLNLLPHRTEILELLPATIPPRTYSHLLPAIDPYSIDEGQFYTLATSESGEYSIRQVQMLSENRTHDLSAEEATAFEAYARTDADHRRDAYALWFTHRMVELDSMYGQLGHAWALGRCAYVGLLEAASKYDKTEVAGLATTNVVSSTPFEEFLEHSDRLFKCVHSLSIPGCCEASLEDWSLLSLHDQILAVVVDDRRDTDCSIEELLHRLRSVFLDSRRHDYALDELVSWLCQVLLSPRKGVMHHDAESLRMLELCAQLIHQSNPANAAAHRWIQDDARLLRTAIDVVYSAALPANQQGSGTDDDPDPDTRRSTHRQFVDALWLIFQSLPERKPTDPPALAQLQVEVDGMEDLLIAMDVLANYGILTSPTAIRDRHSTRMDFEAKTTASESAYALSLVDQMCTFGLRHTIPWTSIWQDALKLKAHVFGERVTQESMLSILLRQLLALDHCEESGDASKYLADAEELVSNWVTANVSALSLPMDILLVSIRERSDHGKDEEASQLVAIAQSLLALPVVAQTEAAQPVVTKFQSSMGHEQNYMKSRELLELLTYGAVKVSRTTLRELHGEKERLDLVMEIFSSNPSNYKMSAKAETWLRQDLDLSPNDVVDHVLDGVMHLASLLRIAPSHKIRIVLKAAYSALYCLDYDTAHRLARKVVQEWSVGQQQHIKSVDAVNTNDEEHSETTTLLLSLVLDVVSSSSFRSWIQKIGLVKMLLAVDSVSLWAHPIADLLVERVRKLEAIQALALELGLSENDLEERREQDQRRNLSAEDELLKELELVVDLLYEEGGQKRQDDRDFVLRLLQKGFQLVMLMQTHTQAPLAPPSPTSRAKARSYGQTDRDAAGENEAPWMIRVLSQMSVIAFQEARRRSAHDDDEWEQAMEAGFSYLLLLSGVEDSVAAVERVWRDELLPLCSRSIVEEGGTSIAHDVFVQRFSIFFQYLAASSASAATSQTMDLESFRVRMKDLTHSARATQAYLARPSDQDMDDFDMETEGDLDGHHGQLSTHRTSTYLTMAKQCQDLQQSQQKSQELEAVSLFLNDDVDLERFSIEAEYRLATIRRMSTRREQLPMAREFATKYGIDAYECVLAYIWHTFFPDQVDLTGLTRHEQLEQAFRGTDDAGGGDDFLEQALQRPLEFGVFLLRPAGGVFESLPGTDHVGILLVLRMILECSKRIAHHDDHEAGDDGESLPLSKSASDRVTLLFMCLKRLKEISGAMQEAPDFKLVCGSQTAHDLLHGAENAEHAETARTIAIAAIAPFLTATNIKMLTKVLQKLHQMSPSAIVMVYLDQALAKIWHEHEHRSINNPPTADLAAYAYESCMPFLSVLSIDHLLIFHTRFVRSDSVEDVSPHFYGQALNSITRFGGYLSSQKRVEIVSDHVALFQSRVEAMKSSNAPEYVVSQRTTQLAMLENQVVEAAFWFVVDKVSQHGLLAESDDSNWLEDWTTRVTAWFALDSLQKAQHEDQVLNALLVFCERATSLDLATLLVELALRVTSPPDFVARAVQDIYCKGVSDVIHKVLTRDGQGSEEKLADRLVGHWAATLVPSPRNEEDVSLRELAQYLAAVESPANAANGRSDSLYQEVLNQFENTASPLVRDIVRHRKEAVASSGLESSLRTAVLAQWKAVIAQYEAQQKWTTSALLSHVLMDADGDVSDKERQYDFGLRVKAVGAWVGQHYQSQEAWAKTLSLPTAELYASFETHVFGNVLDGIEKCNADTRDQMAQHLTIALSIMLRWYEELSGVFRVGDASEQWRLEKEQALRQRLGVSVVSNPSANGTTSSPNDLWGLLLVRGIWDDRLLQWYTYVAYDKITSSSVVAEFVHVRGGAQPALTLMLLLVCPFAELRDQHQMLILRTAHLQLVVSPSVPHSTKVRLLELLLLRLDVPMLLTVDGIETMLLAFYSSTGKTKSLAWTSSVEYYICQLVGLREYAVAGRLVCALWNVHPMLWDLENARLVLGNYLGAMATASLAQTTPGGMEDAVHQARKQAYDHYKRELIG